MCQRIVFGLLFLAAFAIHAQDINIHGKVTNSSGTAVSGAFVELVKEGIKDTTGADGTYQITDATGVIAQSLLPQIEKIALVKGMLKLALTKFSPVKVEIVDASGNLLKKEVYQNYEAGYYSLNIAEQVRSSSMLLIHASIGKQTKTFRYFPLQNGSYATNSSVEGTASVSGKLAKMAAAVSDTIKVTADGYAVKITPVTSYDQELNITLEKEVGDAVAVRLDQEKQTIQGFGINIALAPNALGSTVMNALFSTSGTDALGMSILRVGMNTNGTLTGNTSDLSIARNAGAKIIGSCWSAEAGWKDNGRTDQGGHLYPQYYQQWAERIANFAKNQNLYAMSIANEADFASCKNDGPPCTDDYETMVYTAKEMVEFVKVAGPIFDRIAPNVKMIAPEASLWIHVWSNISPDGTKLPGAPNGGYHSSDPNECGCYANEITEEAAAQCAQKCKSGDGYDYGHWLAADEDAWDAFDILGVHEYESQVAYPWPEDVTGGVRTKEIWQTEMSGVMYWPEQGPSTHIENGVAVARWIQSALTIGEASAWCYWWYEAYYQNDNEGLAITQPEPNKKAKRYYTMGNYSRYMRPGQKVVNITGTDKLPAKVLLTASKDDDGKVVIVAVNENTSAQSVELTIAGGTVPASFKPIVTNSSANWSEKSNVSVANGVLTMELEKMSVTTFVSQ